MIQAYTRNSDDSFRHFTFTSYEAALEALAGKKIIALFDEDVVVDAELTYEQPHNPYNKTIYFFHKRDSSSARFHKKLGVELK